MNVVNQIEQLPIVDEMEDVPTRDEIAHAVNNLNNGKAPGID